MRSSSLPRCPSWDMSTCAGRGSTPVQDFFQGWSEYGWYSAAGTVQLVHIAGTYSWYNWWSGLYCRLKVFETGTFSLDVSANRSLEIYTQIT